MASGEWRDGTVNGAVKHGIALLQSGQTRDAIDVFYEAISIDPENSEAWFQLGIAFHDASQTSDTVYALKRCVQIEPSNSIAWINLSSEQLTAGSIQDAFDSAQQAVKLDPKSADAWNNFGYCKECGGDLAGAIEAYRKAVSVNQRHIISYNNLGLALIKAQDMTGAIRVFTSSTQEFPLQPGLLRGLTSALEHVGNFREALTTYMELVSIVPADVQAWKMIARLRAAFDDKRGAIDAYTRVAALDNADLEANSYLIYGQELIPLFDSLADAFDMILVHQQATKLTRDVDKKYNEALVFMKKGKVSRAIAALRDVVSINPRNFETWTFLAKILLLTSSLDHGH